MKEQNKSVKCISDYCLNANYHAMFLCKVLINKYTGVLLGKMCCIQLPVQRLNH